MAAAAAPPLDKTQPELWIGSLAAGTRPKELQQELSNCGVDVLRCQIKKPKSRRPFAYVRVATQDDLRIALAAGAKSSLRVRGRALRVDKSNRSQNLFITYPTELEILELQTFSIGAFLLRKEAFLQRWCSTELAGMQGSVKCTMNFEKEEVHLCFMTVSHEYKVQFYFKDMQFFLYFDRQTAAKNSTSPSPPYGLVLGFQNAPLVFRKDRGASEAEQLLRAQMMETGDCGGSFYDMLLSDFEDDDEYLWAAGDLESERDWRRTTGTFTRDSTLQGQYFHYLLTPKSSRDLNQIMARLRTQYDAYELHPDSVVVMPNKALTHLAKKDYSVHAKRQPFRLMFLIERMVGEGLLYREMLTEVFFDMLRTETAYRALRHYQNTYCNDLYMYGVVMEDPVHFLCESFDLVNARKDHGSSEADDFKVDCSTGDHVMVYQVTVTPLVIYCEGPNLDTPNRVLRHYKHVSDRFLRVKFADEHHEKLSVGRADEPLTEILDFIKTTLRDGIDVAGRHYEFLAMSNSQLRENSCWFFASETQPDGVTAAKIRSWMGDFSSIKNVAKYAARMGQCFSCTMTSSSLAVGQEEFTQIPDIKTADGKYTFSDGVGLISPAFAKEAAATLRNLRGPTPSAFQIRFAGYKGMVAVHPGVEPPLKMMLRPSMRKFESKHLQLEIIQPVRLNAGHLNRQIILLLSTLGVKPEIFLDLQRKMTAELDDCIHSEKVAMKVLEQEHCLLEVNAPTTMLHTMLDSGFHFAHDSRDVRPEPFLEVMMLAYRNCRLAQLEEKAHIFVEEAACLQGVLDESGYLDYGEVYLRLRDSSGPGRKPKVITGPVVIAKNPCLHPGDIRVLMAMDIPHKGHTLEELENCLVFPRRGPRPHPDECSGSDLDGDTYFVSWNRDLLPPRTMSPATYQGKMAKEVEQVSMDDIFKFFVNYMQNDSLGVICNAHMALADLSERQASDPVCLQLAQLQSDAVDYPKTGVPAKLDPKQHKPPSYPDFMKKRDKTQHRSDKILGRLFRKIHMFQPSLPRSVQQPKAGGSRRLLIDYHREYFDPDLVVAGHEKFCQSAIHCKLDYDNSLKGVMNRYGLRKEEEAIGGFFVKLPRAHRRGSLRDVQTQVRQETARIRQQYLDEEFDTVPDEYSSNAEEYRLQKASAWYVVTYHPTYRNARLPSTPNQMERSPREEMISFPWIAFRYLAAIKKVKSQARASMLAHVSRPAPSLPGSAPDGSTPEAISSTPGQ